MKRGVFLLATALAAMPAGAQAILSDVQITTTSLPDGRVGVPYSAALSLRGGRPLYHWTVSGTLPPGLSLEPITGVIGGTPTDAGTFNFTVRVSDATGSSDTQRLSITIRPAPLQNPLVITASLPAGTLGAQYSAPLTASGGVPPYAWAATGLPPGLSVAADQITGTPAQAGTFTASVQVTDAAATSLSATYNIAISSGLSVTTGPLSGATLGSPYSAGLNAAGGSPPYAWSVPKGNLPAGLTLSPGGQIAGTPSAAGQFGFTVQVSDTAGASASADFTIAVSSALAITTSGLPGGKAGSAYSASLAASGGTAPYSWSVSSGSLPAGLSISGSQITGTPGSAGTANFTVQVTDAAGASASKAFSLSISPNIPPLAIATGSLAAARAGVPYTQTLSATGGTPPYSWSVTSGSLPPGLSISGSQITGTPSSGGTARFTIQVQDSAGQTATAAFTLTVTAALAVSSPAQLPGSTVREAYSYTLGATGGTPPYTWDLTSGALPPGLTLSGGTISGSPTADGTYQFAAQVGDNAGGSVSASFSITIAPGLSIAKPFTMTVVSALTVTTGSPMPAGSVGVSYSQTLTAVAGTSPYTWAVVSGALPPGLAVNVSTGALTGTPTAAGTFTFTVQVRDTLSASASKALAITISPALAITTPSSLPSGTAGHSYSQQLGATGGLPPYTWSVAAGALPSGLALDGAKGSLSGTPQAAGDFQFKLGITDAAGATVSAAAQLHIGLDALPAVAITGLPDSADPLAQPQLGVSIAGKYPVPIAGQLVLTFASDATVPGDDPAIQFSTGGRTVDFTVPANSTQVNLPAQLALQTGSVAGTITVTAVLKAGGVDATPSPAPVHTVKIARSAPVIRSLKMVKTATGFEIWITGYSPSRDLTRATFRFTPASGGDLRTTTADLPLTDSAQQWYQDANSKLFGSQFTIVQPFTVQGSTDAIGTIYVTLTNSAGASQEAQVP